MCLSASRVRGEWSDMSMLAPISLSGTSSTSSRSTSASSLSSSVRFLEHNKQVIG